MSCDFRSCAREEECGDTRAMKYRCSILYACAFDSINVPRRRRSLYCAMQLVRKSFSMRSRRAVFVRWPLNDAGDRWIEPFDHRVIGIACSLFNANENAIPYIHYIRSKQRKLPPCRDASLFRDWCFQEMDKNFSLNLYASLSWPNPFATIMLKKIL